MASVSSNNLIAKNTLLLYARMLLLLGVSLYTSRIVLSTLGVEDYGLYDVVGGVVSMFTFISMAMGNSTNRYITYALGKGDKDELNDVVSAACVIHWVIAILILVLAETLGLWFLHHKMVIPDNRLIAAEWVYQFSIIACMVTIISVPYNAMIISHEKMGAFAAISILDAVLKLLIAYLIQITGHDKLIIYAALILSVNVMNRLIYQLYCKHTFEEARSIKIKKNYPQFREMTSFAGWSMIGNLVYLGYTQGVNILLNMFFGPAVNAARGVAFQVQGAMNGFVTNFQTAINPQIIKSYATRDFKRQTQLVFSGSKFSFFLMLCMVLPVFLEAEGILHLWLKDVPDYSAVFLRLVLLISLVSPLENPIGISNNATGDIKKYQIVAGCFNVLIIFFSYIVLKMGFEPYSVFFVQLIITTIVLFVKILIVSPKIGFTFRDYVSKVLFRVLIVTVSSAIVPSILHFVAPTESLIFLIINCMVGVCSVSFFAFFLGMNTIERSFILKRIKRVIGRYSVVNKSNQ